MTSERFTSSLSEAHDERQVGAKAANLGRLHRLGVAVPPGFVIADRALQTFLDAAALRPTIDAICGPLDPKSPLGVRCAADTIAALIRAERLPAEIQRELVDACDRLGAPAVIVRSSAVGEDSSAASFAGQLDSIAHVTTADTLLRAVVDVWTSRWSDRVLSYERARHVSLAGVGVIVQRQIEAACSGVLFTRAPGNDDQMLLEYCEGLGQALVSGHDNPGRITIARDSFRWSRDVEPDRPVPSEAVLLNDRALGELARTALTIEQAFGTPQDIEWTMDQSGTVWIVQTRPITVARPAAAGNAQFPTVLWSNANVNENFPQPITPLLYSLAREGYYHYFRNLGRSFGISTRRLAAMEAPLRQIIGVHGARMYYNLTNIHAVLRQAPFGDELAASFNQFVGATELSPAGPAIGRIALLSRARRHLTQIGELVVIAIRTTWQYAFLTRRVQHFERTVDEYAARTHPDRLVTRPLPDLLENFQAFVDIRCNRWNDAALADAGSMVCYGVLKTFLARAFPSADQQALHNTLLKALPGLVSSMPPLELWKLSRTIRANRDLHQAFATEPPSAVLSRIGSDPRFEEFRRDFERFLDDWGFRCSEELMLTVPSFQEAPEPVIDLLKAYVSMEGDSPSEQLERQQQERLAETARVLAALGSRRLVVGTVLAWTQKSIQLRERARLKQALLYSRLRRIALAIGARLATRGDLEQPADVFFLTSHELDALVSGSEMFPHHIRSLVRLRQQAHREVSATTPPDTIRLAAGDYLPAVPSEEPEGAVNRGSNQSFSGVGACGGSTSGRAAILRDVTQSHLLSPGDVLVTRQTDPGWGPVFPLISGLVMERGGMLSHGAIIAREFGIPSVVGVKDATRLIPHGGTVSIDGDRGLVRILSEAC